MVCLAALGDKYGNPPVASFSKSDFDEILVFELDYDLLNAALAQHTDELRIEPGTALAIFGMWEKSASCPFSHQSGGFSRLGAFYLPQRLENPLPLSGVSSGNNQRGTVKPMDMEVAYPEALTRDYPALRPGGKATSRVEAEGKLDIPLDQIFNVYRRIEALTGDARLASRVLGKHWSIEPIERYYVRDEAGKLLRDNNGLPLTDPMVDVYTDDAQGSLARSQSVFRLRSKEGDRINTMNFKPGAGVADEDLPYLRHRIERGLEIADDADPDELQDFLGHTQPLNPLRDLHNVAPGVLTSELRHPVMRVVDQRYKFMLRHYSENPKTGELEPDGIEVELSLDDCFGVPLEASDEHSDGVPRRKEEGTLEVVHIGQLELEVAHMNLVSANAYDETGARSFDGELGLDADAVASCLSNLGDDARFVGPPPLHELSDLPGFFDGDDTYRTFKKMVPGLVHYLLDGAEPVAGRQKNHELCKLAGIIDATDEERQAYKEELSARAAIDHQGPPDLEKYFNP